MGFLTDTGSANPAKFRMEIKSGKVQYYDKELGQNVEVPVPFEFVALEQVGAIKGWSAEDGSAYWSNEVRRTDQDPFTIRTQKGVKASGFWKDIKTDPNIADAKFYAVIYVAHHSENGMVISKISLKGAALKAWIEFSKANRKSFKNNKVVLSEWSDEKNGVVRYQKPIFTLAEMTDEESKEAHALNTKLEAYFNDYFNRDAQNAPESNQKDDVVIEDIDDDPINLDDIPF